MDFQAILENVDWASAVARLHPVFLHFPVVLVVALAAAEVWRKLRNRPERDATRGVLVFLLATTTPIAATSGWLLHETESYGAGVEWHEYLGIGLLATALGASICYWRSSKAYGWWLASSVLLLFPTAHLGGALTHGDDFLTEPWADAIEAAQAPAPPHTDERGLATSLETDLETGLETDLGSGPATDPSLGFATESTGVPAEAPTADFAVAAPFLEQYCTRCHGERKRKGGLALHDLPSLLAGGDSGSVLVAGRSDQSRLIEVLRLPLDHEDHMPPPEKGQPSAEEIAAIAAWIDGAAPTLEGPGSVADANPAEGAQPQAASALASTDEAAEPPVSEPEAVEQPPLEPAPLLDPEAARAAILALQNRQAHVERLEAGGELLLVGFGAAAGTLHDGLGALIEPLAPVIAELDLSANRVSAADLAAVGALPRLERLDLRRLEGPAPALAELARSKSLRAVNLAGTEVSAADLEALAAAPALEQLVLWNAGQTPEWLAQFAAAHPQLEVRGASAPPAAAVEVEPEVAFVRFASEPDPVADAAVGDGLRPSNTTCPVSGSPVDPRFSVVHGEQVVGFCCPNCPKSFWDDPDRYADSLAGD